MDKSHITFEELPQAVGELFAELEEIKRLLGNLQPPAPARRPIPRGGGVPDRGQSAADGLCAGPQRKDSLLPQGTQTLLLRG